MAQGDPGKILLVDALVAGASVYGKVFAALFESLQENGMSREDAASEARNAALMAILVGEVDRPVQPSVPWKVEA